MNEGSQCKPVAGTKTCAPEEESIERHPQSKGELTLLGKSLVCGVLLVIIAVAYGRLETTGALKEVFSESGDKSMEAQKILAQSMGPSNPIARRINSLNVNNAYSAGATDGGRETISASVDMNWGRHDYQNKLAEMRAIKREVFMILASQNKFNKAVFDQYVRGWDYGASTLRIR